MQQMSCFINLHQVAMFGYAEIIVSCVMDRVVSILTGSNHIDNIPYYVATRCSVDARESSYYQDAMQETENEIRMIFDMLEADQVYQLTLGALAAHSGKLFTIPVANPSHVVVLVQTE